MNQVEVIEGYSILVKNVSKDELKKYEQWLDKTSWSGNMGYTLYPSKQPNKVTLQIESGFSGTWFRDIKPELEDYWGIERIINEVKFPN